MAVVVRLGRGEETISRDGRDDKQRTSAITAGACVRIRNVCVGTEVGVTRNNYTVLEPNARSRRIDTRTRVTAVTPSRVL